MSDKRHLPVGHVVFNTQCCIVTCGIKLCSANNNYELIVLLYLLNFYGCSLCANKSSESPPRYSVKDLPPLEGRAAVGL